MAEIKDYIPKVWIPAVYGAWPCEFHQQFKNSFCIFHCQAVNTFLPKQLSFF